MGVPKLAKHAAGLADAAAGSIAGTKLEDDAVSQAKVADDAVGAAQLKVVVRDVTVANGAATGTVTNAADIDGVIIGVVPKSGVDSAVAAATLTAVSGKIDVTVVTNQTGDGVVSVVVLQA